jgi:hypothetical protein
LLALVDQSIAMGKLVNSELSPRLFAFRIQIYQEKKDAAGCRATAELWEKRRPTDRAGLYNAARFRAIAAAVQAKTSRADALRLAQEDADRAMAWLTKAVAAGNKDHAHIEKDSAFEFLREREDFKKLLAEPKPKEKEM